MTFSQITSWAVAHPELAVVAAGALLSIPGAIYAVVKTAFQAITGRAAKGPVWTTLDVIVEVLPNLPGAINRAVRGAGLPSIFAPRSRDTVAPPPSDPQAGAVRVGALLAICGGVLLATLAGAVLTGCPSPRLPAVEGCTVGASRCRADRPQVCSSTGRWHDVGDLACAASGAVCAEGTDGGVAHCALATNGGSDAR